MPEFFERPKTVEAIQFTGGHPNATEVIKWLYTHRYDAAWSPEIRDGNDHIVERETIHIRHPNFERTWNLWVNDWFVRDRQNGSDRMSNHSFTDMYQPAEEDEIDERYRQAMEIHAAYLRSTLPDPPTHFIVQCGPFETCQVHGQIHGWYKCLPDSSKKPDGI